MKDPAFLFYDGDAARDVSHMNRLERGAYFDIIQAQRKFGGITVEQARKILGKDFDEVWPAIELILTKSEDKYFIEWVSDSIENRKEYAEKQRKRIQDYWDKKKKEEENGNLEIPRNNYGISTDIPLENERGNERENERENEDKGVIGGNEKENPEVVYLNDPKPKKKNSSKSPPEKPDFELIYPFDSKKFIEAWNMWKAFKKEQFKFTYKPIGEQGALKDLAEISDGSEDRAIKLIHYAISKTWKGIYDVKDFNQGITGKPKNSLISDEYKARTIIEAINSKSKC